MDHGQNLETVYNPHSVEKAVYESWESAGAFRSQPADTPRDRTFTIVIPPPNVTGALHLGHALNNTLQDILVRYYRMRGFNTLWQPGTDHAGIATQAVVERRIRETEGKNRHDLGREELVRRIWEWKADYEQRIIGQLKLMGCSCDWERTRFTLDEGLARAVRHQFFHLFKDGLIFRGKRLVNWDTDLQTAVANDEVYHETVEGHFWHIRYPLIESQPDEPKHVVIATTRPETMLGDTAVAVHPDPQAFFEKQENALRESLAGASAGGKPEIEAKLEALTERRESHLAGLIKLADMARDGRKVLLPLVQREIPLITDDWADPTKGSGCVKITPAHDPNDYEVGLRNDLPMINVLTADGKIARIMEADGSVNSHSGDYEGLEFAGAGRDRVVANLEARDLIESIEDHTHEVGHSDRSKTPIEPFLSDQWFVKTGDIAEPQASACANAQISKIVHSSLTPRLRSPDLSLGATLLTWTTYGTWLPGDDRGSVSRAPRLEGKQSLRNLPGEPYDRDDPHRQTGAAERMEGTPVHLTREHATRLLMCIADTCERHGLELLAVAIMANHVHVLCQGEQHGRDMLQALKGNASRRLNLGFKLEGAPRWWTKSGSRRRIKRGADLTAAIEYVKNQEYPLLLWSFDAESGDAARIVEEARWQVHAASPSEGETVESGTFAQAEACGSAGVRLGDGQLVPGLAQAAIDVVNSGRIKVFPDRYAKSYLDWLGEKRDWCISRQLWWGHQIRVCKITVSRATHEGAYEIGASNRAVKDRIANLRAFFEKCRLDGVCIKEAGTANGVRALFFLCNKDVQVDDLLSSAIEILAHRSGATTDERRTYLRLREELTERFGKEALAVLDGLHGSVTIDSCDPDVLDTWFSSALWPFSTLGWPEKTDHLKQYYPGSVLITSRDIITNWVARMVMFGLYAMGEVPFDHVYIHPKILDGRGETMSKMKGNGVDPVDIIHTHGADALRYTMADMTTETQDIRMPVEYICPHCDKLVDQGLVIKAETQARKSRGEKLARKLQPSDCKRVTCTHKACGKDFGTRWADEATKEEFPVARETSDKFDIGRNFCNKLWNAARFAFLNLKDTPCRPIDIASLPPEDRWILAKLSRTVRNYHKLVQTYQFSASIRELREFFWDCLCDWYIELTKPRLNPDLRTSLRADSQANSEPRASARAVSQSSNEPPASFSADAADSHSNAKQVLAFCLDQSLRLFHPTMPFITEKLWSTLNATVAQRGLPGAVELKCDTQLVLAPFPPENGYRALDDDAIVNTFEELQDVTRSVRELRSAAGVSPKDKVHVTVAAPPDRARAITRHSHIVQHMAGIDQFTVDAKARRPKNSAGVNIHGLRIFVHDISDDEAERKRAEKSLTQLEKQIAGKEAKLGNEKFLANAKPDIVAAERKRLDRQLQEREALKAHLLEMAE